MSEIQVNNCYGCVIFPTKKGIVIPEDAIIKETYGYTNTIPEGDELYKFCDLITSYLTRIDNAFLVHHHLNGEACTFTAETHYHLVQELPTKDFAKRDCSVGITNDRKFKALKGELEKLNFTIKSQQVANLYGIIGYLKQPPRIYIGATSIQMDNLFQRIPMQLKRKGDEDNDTPPTKKTKESAIDKMDKLQGLMEKYKESSIRSLLNRAKKRNNNEDVIFLKNLLCSSTGNRLESAAALCLLQDEIRDYAHIFMDDTTEEDLPNYLDMENYMTGPECHQLFMKWAEEMKDSISSGTYFLTCMYAVLFKKVQKRNTLILTGAASSGKTFLTNPVLWLKQFVGKVGNDSHFSFADLVTSKIAYINEIVFMKSNFNTLKELMEGLSTNVAVKNEPLQEVQSQPVIMTVNDLPWELATNVEGAKEAVLERSYMFNFTKASEVLRQHKRDTTNKAMNPYWLKGVFTVLEEALADTNMAILLEDKELKTPIWKELDQLLYMEKTIENPCYESEEEDMESINYKEGSIDSDWEDDTALLEELNRMEHNITPSEDIPKTQEESEWDNDEELLQELNAMTSQQLPVENVLPKTSTVHRTTVQDGGPLTVKSTVKDILGPNPLKQRTLLDYTINDDDVDSDFIKSMNFKLTKHRTVYGVL